MGRRKLQIKPIADKSSRQVTFSKRRAGLVKKANELSVLCDVDIALLIFSNRGKLYEFCSQGSSLSQMFERYLEHFSEPAPKGANEPAASIVAHGSTMDYSSGQTRLQSHIELLQRIQRYIEGLGSEKLEVVDLVQLEKQLDIVLTHTRTRKTQLMMESVMPLRQQEKMPRQENQPEKVTQLMSWSGSPNNHVPNDKSNQLNNDAAHSLPQQLATFRWMRTC